MKLASATDFFRLDEAFRRVVATPLNNRAAVIEASCGGDADLRRDLERMLEIDQSLPGFAQDDVIDGILAARAAAALATHGAVTTTHPRRIGAYDIDCVIGAGGMGMVYRARQPHPAREVALKVLHSSLLSASLRQRFQREAEILGRLQHPGIAQVHEAGEWICDGRSLPFFAMELVDGEPLTDYARTHKLRTRERLALLANVCDAMEYAHSTGVIHRDLKPGNILVDGAGRPRILDFGIARVIDSDVQMTTQQTDMGQLIGTVAYMSPEQAAGDPSAIDHRSDVYALGVIMYELLAGEPPMNLHRRSLSDAVRAIRDDDPAPLSAISRQFRGDLETIVGRAMEKDRQRRYQGAGQLAADIRRFINEEPIAARAPSRIYQLHKFSRRHKGLVAGLAATMITLIAGLVVSTSFAMRAERRSRQLALETQRLLAVNEFFAAMFDAANSDINQLDLERPSDVRVVEVLDFAATQLADAYAAQPDVEISLRKRLSETYAQIDEGEKALAQIERALELAERTMDPADPERIRIAIASAGLINSLGRHGEAEALLRPLLRQCERVNGGCHPETIACMNGLFAALYYQHRHTESLELGESTLQRANEAVPADHSERKAALNNLAYVLNDEGQHERAESLFREALDVSLRVHGEVHPATIAAWRNLVMALRPLGRIDEAIGIMRRVVDAQTRLYGEDHPLTLLSMNNFAILLRDHGDEGQSMQILEKTVSLYERGGRDTSNSLLARHNLANAHFRQNQHERAQAMAQDVVEARIRLHGSDAPEVAHSQHLLAQILVAQSKATDALPLFQSAMTILNRVNGDVSPSTMSYRLDYARCLLAAHQLEQAEAEFSALYVLSLRVNGPQHDLTLACDHDLETVRHAMAGFSANGAH